MPAPNSALQIFVASSNEGKLREYRTLAAAAGVALKMVNLPNFARIPSFEETAATFGENAVGKVLHYSRFESGLVIADDSGLVVPALGGAPGVYSARYAGPDATDVDRVHKLVGAMSHMEGEDRSARFVCVIALAKKGKVCGVFSASADGEVLGEMRGQGGFGYDPIFYVAAAGKTFAELSREEKNLHSHRGIAFRKVLKFLQMAK